MTSSSYPPNFNPYSLITQVPEFDTSAIDNKLIAEVVSRSWDQVIRDTTADMLNAALGHKTVGGGTSTTLPRMSISLDSIREAMKQLPPPEVVKDTPLDLIVKGRWMPTDRMCAQLVPARTVRDRPWHAKRGYSRRVSKKWLKRYGKKPFMDKTQMLVDDMNKVVHVHTDVVKKLAEELKVPYDLLLKMRYDPTPMMLTGSSLFRRNP